MHAEDSHMPYALRAYTVRPCHPIAPGRWSPLRAVPSAHLRVFMVSYVTGPLPGYQSSHLCCSFSEQPSQLTTRPVAMSWVALNLCAKHLLIDRCSHPPACSSCLHPPLPRSKLASYMAQPPNAACTGTTGCSRAGRKRRPLHFLTSS